MVAYLSGPLIHPDLGIHFFRFPTELCFVCLFYEKPFTRTSIAMPCTLTEPIWIVIELTFIHECTFGNLDTGLLWPLVYTGNVNTIVALSKQIDFGSIFAY